MRWRVLFYVKSNGEKPVEDFLRKLPPGHQGKAMRAIDHLEQFGIFLQRPHAAAIKSGRFSGLRELRIHFGGDASRIIYFLHSDDCFILLHGFIKKTDALPVKEMEIARKRKEDIFRRFKK
jgi:phage-related protein